MRGPTTMLSVDLFWEITPNFYGFALPGGPYRSATDLMILRIYIPGQGLNIITESGKTGYRQLHPGPVPLNQRGFT